MEDDFDLKPRLRKLAMIAAGVVALVVLAVDPLLPVRRTRQPAAWPVPADAGLTSAPSRGF